MISVLRFHQLAKAMERSSLPVKAKYFGYDDYPNSPKLERKMSGSFHRAVYRILLCGPVLTGWYLEPFCNNGYLAEGLFQHTGGYEYLESYLAYNLAANVKLSPKLDTIFGSLSSWLISSIKEHLTSEDLQWAQKVPGFLDSPQLQSTEPRLLGISNTNKEEIGAILREVMNMMLAMGILKEMMEKYEKNCQAHQYKKGGGTFWSQQNYLPRPQKDGLSTCKNLDKMIAIILGVHQPQELRVNHDLGFVGTRPIAHGRTSSPVPRDWDARRYHPPNHSLGDIHWFQYWQSGSVNQIDGEYAWRQDHQLFAYILHRYFNIQLAPFSHFGFGVQEFVTRPLPWALPLSENANSAPIWLRLLKPTPRAPVYSYSRMF